MNSPHPTSGTVTGRRPFERVGLIARSWDSLVGETSDRLHAFFARQGLAVQVDATGPIATLHGAQALPRTELGTRCDLLVAIGGDGTMLDAAQVAARTNTPLVGINRGRLGFLADIKPEDMIEALGALLDGQFAEETRLMLEARCQRADGTVTTAIALNDIVVQKYDVGRMLEVTVQMGGTYVNRHRGDGLIVATPTGSTAYALSGGGPIMAPGLDAIAMVPICPHTLSDRPVVVPADAALTLTIDEPAGAHSQIMTDGQLLSDLHPTDRLDIARAEQRVRLLHPVDYDYFRILRSKLAWGRGEPNRIT